MEGGLYLNICAMAPRVPSYATADGAGLSTHTEESVRCRLRILHHIYSGVK